MRRFLILLVAAVFVWAPVQAQVSVQSPGGRVAGPTHTTGDYSKIRTVAVLSGIGSTLSIQKQRRIGWTPTESAIDDWGIDASVVSRVREYLGGRFAFRDVAYDTRAMGRLPARFLRDTNREVRRFFDTVPKEGVDAYIVVRRESIARDGATMRSSPGLALYDPTIGDNPTRTVDKPMPILVANYAIDVLSPARLAVIATASAQIRYREGGETYFAEFVGDEDLRMNVGAGPSETQRVRLRAEFERLMSLSLIDTLRALDFGAPLPPVGASRTVAPFAPDKDPFAHIRNIGVVAAIGDRFHFGWAGRTALGDANDSLPIEGWGVDRHVEDTARRMLSPRFEVKDVTVDRTALLRSSLRDGFLVFNPMIQGVEQTSDVDAYVLFLKFPIELGFENYEGLGLGLFNHQATSSRSRQVMLFAHYAVVVVDAKTGEMIRTVTGTVSPESPIPRATRGVDSSLWAETVAKLTADQKDSIRRSLFELLGESLDETLTLTGLRGNAVSYPPGIRAEGCWPRPEDANSARIAPMVGIFGVIGGAAGGALVGALASATSGPTAMGHLPMQFDQYGSAC